MSQCFRQITGFNSQRSLQLALVVHRDKKIYLLWWLAQSIRLKWSKTKPLSKNIFNMYKFSDKYKLWSNLLGFLIYWSVISLSRMFGSSSVTYMSSICCNHVFSIKFYQISKSPEMFNEIFFKIGKLKTWPERLMNIIWLPLRYWKSVTKRNFIRYSVNILYVNEN